MERLAVIENLISGRDNQVRAVELRTATGKTNRPITKLYPLEVNSANDQERQVTEQDVPHQTSQQPAKRQSHRIAASTARRQIASWIRNLRPPPSPLEDVETLLS